MTSPGSDRFGLLREIDPDREESWRGRVFLTLDLDYAADDVLREAIDLVAGSGRPATWFVTHATPLLDELRRVPRFQLGLHPNFERLMWRAPDGAFAGAAGVLEALRTVVPEATAVRSHFLTSSSALGPLLAGAGLTHESNFFLPVWSGMALRPFRTPAGLVHVPFGWEDDVAVQAELTPSAAELLRHDGLNVFNFHPVHLAANTATPRQLERVIGALSSPLAEVRAALRGTRRPRGRLGARDELVRLVG